MAIDIQRISPLDLDERQAVGINLPFAGPFSSNYTTKDAVRNNLINYFLTAPGERRLNGEFGAGLRELLFNNLTEDLIEEIKERITEDIKALFPRIILNEINISPSYDTNTIIFQTKYAMKDSNIIDQINIELANDTSN
jgi:phage baseplate assembly protein W|tara:strand:+ start:933 stop:1349 length:417 start_codon:yes stop_codon:yes gene_type:complete